MGVTREDYIKWLDAKGQDLVIKRVDGIKVEVIHHRWDKTGKYDILTTPSLIKLYEHKNKRSKL